MKTTNQHFRAAIVIDFIGYLFRIITVVILGLTCLVPTTILGQSSDEPLIGDPFPQPNDEQNSSPFVVSVGTGVLLRDLSDYRFSRPSFSLELEYGNSFSDRFSYAIGIRGGFFPIPHPIEDLCTRFPSLCNPPPPICPYGLSCPSDGFSKLPWYIIPVAKLQLKWERLKPYIQIGAGFQRFKEASFMNELDEEIQVASSWGKMSTLALGVDIPITRKWDIGLQYESIRTNSNNLEISRNSIPYSIDGESVKQQTGLTSLSLRRSF